LLIIVELSATPIIISLIASSKLISKPKSPVADVTLTKVPIQLHQILAVINVGVSHTVNENTKVR
jgi:hypothetical protein